MLLFIVGFIPYIVLVRVMASLGIEIDQWQWWTLLGCLLATDFISYVRTKLES